jgi:hypothetical protein
LSESSASETKTPRFTCEQCGITFDTNDEKDEHKKLEHSEHKPPSGVG